MVSDAAFKKEADDGYSLRGALYLRCGGTQTQDFARKDAKIHILDWACKTQKCVTRSTFAAELLACGNAADTGILTSHLLYELEYGPLSITRAREKRDFGGYLPVCVCM